MAPNFNSSDYYEILGVPRGSDEAALKKAYRKLAVKVSPMPVVLCDAIYLSLPFC